jgi:hypothetical protein
MRWRQSIVEREIYGVRENHKAAEISRIRFEH